MRASRTASQRWSQPRSTPQMGTTVVIKGLGGKGSAKAEAKQKAGKEKGGHKRKGEGA